MDSDYRGVAEQCFEKGETSPKGTYFRESHAGEVPRIHLLGTSVNKGIKKGPSPNESKYPGPNGLPSPVSETGGALWHM
jgi:hypothetical protein